MAIDTPARHIYSGDGSTRVFPIPTYIQGDDYIRIEIGGVHQVDRSKWDIVNNSIIFVTAPITTSTIDVQVATSVEALTELGSITNIDIVAGINDKIITVANNLDIIENGYSIFEINEHMVNINNPHSVTKEQVGLSNVDNTSDANKSISTATQSVLDLKADDNTVVKLTGNQTVAGVKTFTSSPIVPTPTTDAQSANKAYVDNVSGGWSANDTRAKTALNASGTAPIYACRAWVNFNGTGTVAIRASGNVSSITDNGVGLYTVNFTTAMPDANYSTVHGSGSHAASNTTQIQTMSSVNISSGIPWSDKYDMLLINCAIFR